MGDDQILEKVARAICKAQTQTERLWLAFLPEAGAALSVVLEDIHERAMGWPEARDWIKFYAKSNDIDLAEIGGAA